MLVKIYPGKSCHDISEMIIISRYDNHSICGVTLLLGQDQEDLGNVLVVSNGYADQVH